MSLDDLSIEEIDIKIENDISVITSAKIGEAQDSTIGSYVFLGLKFEQQKFNILSFEIKENKFGIFAGNNMNANVSDIRSTDYTLLKESVHPNTIYYFKNLIDRLNDGKFDFGKINNKIKISKNKTYKSFDNFFNLPPKSKAENPSEIGKLRIVVIKDENKQNKYDFRFAKKIPITAETRDIIKFDEIKEKINTFDKLISLFSNKGLYKVFIVPCNLTSEIGKQSIKISWKLLAVQELGMVSSQIDDMMGGILSGEQRLDDEEMLNRINESNDE